MNFGIKVKPLDPSPDRLKQVLCSISSHCLVKMQGLLLLIGVSMLGLATAGFTKQQKDEILDAHNSKRHELKLPSSKEPDLVS